MRCPYLCLWGKSHIDLGRSGYCGSISGKYGRTSVGRLALSSCMFQQEIFSRESATYLFRRSTGGGLLAYFELRRILVSFSNVPQNPPVKKSYQGCRSNEFISLVPTSS